MEKATKDDSIKALCGFKDKKECDEKCKYFKSCTRRSDESRELRKVLKEDPLGVFSINNPKEISEQHSSEKIVSNTQQKEPLVDVAVSFEGIREVSMKLIEIPEHFRKTRPSQDKVMKTIEYYKTHGKFDKPVQLLLLGDKYLLKDKYLRYHVAKLLKIETIEAIFSEGGKINSLIKENNDESSFNASLREGISN